MLQKWRRSKKFDLPRATLPLPNRPPHSGTACSLYTWVHPRNRPESSMLTILLKLVQKAEFWGNCNHALIAQIEPASSQKRTQLCTQNSSKHSVRPHRKALKLHLINKLLNFVLSLKCQHLSCKFLVHAMKYGAYSRMDGGDGIRSRWRWQFINNPQGLNRHSSRQRLGICHCCNWKPNPVNTQNLQETSEKIASKIVSYRIL